MPWTFSGVRTHFSARKEGDGSAFPCEPPATSATASDLIAGQVVHGWLRERGIPGDMALAVPNGSFDWRTVDPAPYTYFVFVCGPFGRDWISEFRARFAHCHTIGVNLSMIDGSNPFDMLLARDGRPSRHGRCRLSVWYGFILSPNMESAAKPPKLIAPWKKWSTPDLAYRYRSTLG
ncbi:MAG TPA: hypothetical protein VGG64_05470 [Pirellulales bacterium]|jgi:hypothetical protein